MATHDLRALIHSNLPKSLKLADPTQVVTFDWFDAEPKLPAELQDELPHGRFRIEWGQQHWLDLEGGVRKPAAGYPSHQEDIDYPLPSSPYLLEQPDVEAGSMVLTGTVGGAAFTFEEGTHYEVVNVKPYAAGSLNGIRFKSDSPVLPDDGTPLSATYRHIMNERVRSSRRDPVLKLMFNATDIAANTAEQPGITAPIEGHDLVEQMGQSLVEAFVLLRGKALDASKEVSFGHVRPIGPITTGLEGSRYRFAVEVGLKVHSKTLVELVPRILRHDLTSVIV